MSPYLFVLCMERLGHCIRQATEDEIWEAILLLKDRPSISHLFFTDDIVLFCKTDIYQANMVNEILQKFRRCSGHKVNKSKSQVFFSTAVENVLATQITNTLKMERVDDLGRYLGVLIFHKCVTNSMYSFIIEKVRKRLSG